MKNKDLAEHLKTLLSERRYHHTMEVVRTAQKMADLYGIDRGKAEAAALLHDIARDFSGREILQMCQKYNIAVDEIEKSLPDLLHGKVGAYLAKNRYGIEDGEVLDAIRFHTTGRKNMSVLEKVVFLADMIEPARDFPGVAGLRELAWQNLDRAVMAGLDSTIRYVLQKGFPVHPNSIEARNALLGSAGNP